MARWSIGLVCLVIGGLAGSFYAGSTLFGDSAPAPIYPKEMTSYHPVVERVLPAVVSIEAHFKPKARAERTTPRVNPFGQFGNNEQVPEEFRKFFDQFQHQFEMPEATPRGSFGSGFIIDPKGVVLTNYHVVGGADHVEIHLMDGSHYTSRDIHGDRKSDLAVVRFHPQGAVAHLELGDSDAMQIGDRVLAVGAPFGLTGTVTAGIVSAKGRNSLNVNMYEDFIQTDAAINPGNSGGPLVNMEGKVIGINSAIKSGTGGWQGVGLAISSNMARNIMQSLLNGGVVHRGYLGVQIGDLAPEVATQLGLSAKSGVVVRNVFEGSPAAKAGLRDGDIVTALDGKPVKSGHELQQIVAGLPLHKPAELTVYRDGKQQQLSVTIQEQPEDYGTTARAPRSPSRHEESEAMKLDKIGIQVEDLTSDTAGQLGYKENTTGVVITHVDPGSIAAEKGLTQGMLITRVGKDAVKSAADVKRLVEKANLEKGILLQVQTPGSGTAYVVLKAESAEPVESR
jgi:serine protease Do